MQWNNNYTEDDDYEDDEFHEIALMVLFPRRRKVFQRRRNYFEVLNDDEFFDRFRLFKSTVMFVIDKIRNQIWLVFEYSSYIQCIHKTCFEIT